MPFYFTHAVIRTADNVAANYATNRWWVEADDLTALGDWHTNLSFLYGAMDGFWSNQVAASSNLILTSYNNLDPEPRPPVLENTYNVTPVGTAGLPPEVSLCLSFQGDRMAGVPQARRRGRIYFPFLTSNSNGTDGRPTSTIVDALRDAGDALLTASSSATDWTWVVYSAVEPGYTVITNGWVDNEWDTQRRRGRPPTSREVYP
jgi:hypothetical protein